MSETHVLRLDEDIAMIREVLEETLSTCGDLHGETDALKRTRKTREGYEATGTI